MKQTFLFVLLFVFAILLYGIISYRVFQRPTFLSWRSECPPTPNPAKNFYPAQDRHTPSIQERLFGSNCYIKTK